MYYKLKTCSKMKSCAKNLSIFSSTYKLLCCRGFSYLFLLRPVGPGSSSSYPPSLSSSSSFSTSVASSSSLAENTVWQSSSSWTFLGTFLGRNLSIVIVLSSVKYVLGFFSSCPSKFSRSPKTKQLGDCLSGNRKHAVTHLPLPPPKKC